MYVVVLLKQGGYGTNIYYNYFIVLSFSFNSVSMYV